MKWSAKDLSIYLENTSYVDTAIIPLIPVEFGKDMLTAAREGEYIHQITIELERQLTGRIIKLPPFTYLKKEDSQHRLTRLQEWHNTCVENDLKQCFYITSDPDWRNEEGVANRIIWLPVLPVDLIDQKQLNLMIDETIQDLITEIKIEWVQSD